MAAEGMKTGRGGKKRMSRQWGRDRMAAEGPAVRKIVKERHDGVNGAATGWPRKVQRAGIIPNDPRQASMGPRPDGRGRPCCGTDRGRAATGVNGAATGWPRKVVVALYQPVPDQRQWGRDRMAAEGPKLIIPNAEPERRQWGRDRMAAEGLQLAYDTLTYGQRQWGRDRMAAEGATPRRRRCRRP